MPQDMKLFYINWLVVNPGGLRTPAEGVLVPKERLELSRGVASADFESAASTDSATQA
jgi:hypothetical protein